MTKITFQQFSPKGTATIDTERLFVGTDGRLFVRDSANSRLVTLGDEQVAAIRKHFGRRLSNACLAVKALA